MNTVGYGIHIPLRIVSLSSPVRCLSLSLSLSLFHCVCVWPHWRAFFSAGAGTIARAQYYQAYAAIQCQEFSGARSRFSSGRRCLVWERPVSGVGESTVKMWCRPTVQFPGVAVCCEMG